MSFAEFVVNAVDYRMVFFFLIEQEQVFHGVVWNCLFLAVFVEQSLSMVAVASLLVTESLNKSITMLAEAV